MISDAARQFRRFWGAARQYQAILGCSTSISSDFGVQHVLRASQDRCRFFTGQWIESVTDWAIRITDWCLSTDWTASRARLLDPIRPMPDNGSFEHPGSPIALISRLPDWAVQSILPIAIPPIAPSILSTGQPVEWRGDQRSQIAIL